MNSFRFASETEPRSLSLFLHFEDGKLTVFSPTFFRWITYDVTSKCRQAKYIYLIICTIKICKIILKVFSQEDDL